MTITPKKSTNKLRIRSKLFFGLSAVSQGVCAIFQDAAANAIVAGSATMSTNNAVGSIDLVYEMVAGTTLATTFKLRAGPGAATTMTINGSAGARQFGGVTISSIQVEEIEA